MEAREGEKKFILHSTVRPTYYINQQSSGKERWRRRKIRHFCRNSQATLPTLPESWESYAIQSSELLKKKKTCLKHFTGARLLARTTTFSRNCFMEVHEGLAHFVDSLNSKAKCCPVKLSWSWSITPLNDFSMLSWTEQIPAAVWLSRLFQQRFRTSCHELWNT